MWVGLIESVEGLNRRKTDLPEKEKKSVSWLLWGLHCNCFPGLQLAELFSRFWVHCCCCCCCQVAAVVSDFVWPHRWQPTRLPHPWDSPGKDTGVGCHCLLQCIKVKSESEVAQLCPTLRDPMDCSLPGSSLRGIFPGKNTGVGCHRLLRWVH